MRRAAPTVKPVLDSLARNGLYDWGVALAIIVATLLLAAALRRLLIPFVTRLARRTPGKLDDALAQAIQSTNLLVLSPVAIFLGAAVLELPPPLGRFLSQAAVIALLVQFGLWANRFLVETQSLREESTRSRDPAAATALHLIGFGARTLVWVLLLLVALKRLGLDISALLAGLGVGGIAIALAVQNILGDLFASLSIVLDKPFVVGDFIILDNYLGTVDNVGIKTTRLRSLGGELLVISNADLLRSRIRNYRQMQERRIVFSVGVTYQTPAARLKELPQLLREAVQAQPDTRFDRAHFKEFGESQLTFEVVYYVLSPDYNKYMDTQQAINMALVDSFGRLGVEFAYPTRTLFVESAPPSPAPAGQKVPSATP